MIGLLLGVVWAPCVGPTLGVAIAAASQGQDLLASFLIFLVFGLGVATSVLAFAYGSRKAMGERGKTLAIAARYGKPLFGGALLVVGLMVVTGFDKVIEIALLDALPPSVIAFTTQLVDNGAIYQKVLVIAIQNGQAAAFDIGIVDEVGPIGLVMTIGVDRSLNDRDSSRNGMIGVLGHVLRVFW